MFWNNPPERIRFPMVGEDFVKLTLHSSLIPVPVTGMKEDAWQLASRELQTHFTEALGVIAPVLAHLHEQEEMHRLFEDL